MVGDEGEDDCSDCLVVRKNMKCIIYEFNKNIVLLFILFEIYMNCFELKIFCNMLFIWCKVYELIDYYKIIYYIDVNNSYWF